MCYHCPLSLRWAKGAPPTTRVLYCRLSIVVCRCAGPTISFRIQSMVLFKGQQMILKDKIYPLHVYLFHIFYLYLIFCILSLLFSPPHSKLLALVQRLLSFITCCRFKILQSEITSWLLHWPATIVLAGSKHRGFFLLARDLSCK